MLDIGRAMKFELLYYVCIRVFNDIEIAIIAITRDKITVFPIPLGMLNAYILCWYHLAVEQYVLGAILLIILLYKSENCLYKLQVIGIV